MFCRELVAQLRDHAPKIQAQGASIAAIGCGSAEQAGALHRAMELPFPLYADPERGSFDAAGLRRDLFGLNPVRTTLSAMRAFWNGARQAGVQGDPWQLGGTFAVDVDGTVLYAHRSSAAGDHAPIDELVAALNPPSAPNA